MHHFLSLSHPILMQFLWLFCKETSRERNTNIFALFLPSLLSPLWAFPRRAFWWPQINKGRGKTKGFWSWHGLSLDFGILAGEILSEQTRCLTQVHFCDSVTFTKLPLCSAAFHWALPCSATDQHVHWESCLRTLERSYTGRAHMFNLAVPVSCGGKKSTVKGSFPSKQSNNASFNKCGWRTSHTRHGSSTAWERKMNHACFSRPWWLVLWTNK